MYTYHHPRPALTVDIVVFGITGNRIQVLLIQRANEPFANSWALPGGFVEIAEGLDEAAVRELKEETGITPLFLEQFHTFGNPKRDPRGRVISVAYLTLITQNEMQNIQHGSDASAVKWFSLKSLPNLAFDHDEIISLALKKFKQIIE
ncbi:MAG: NUDIX hydrolase [Anaerolineaceae bacterium]